MAINDFNIGLVGKLDGTKSKHQLNNDIDAIKTTLKELELKAKLDPNQVKALESQLNTLQVKLVDVSFTQPALDGLVNQINNALKNIQISHINIGSTGSGGGVNKQALQIGKQAGNIISDEVSNALDRITSKEIEIPFKVKKTYSDDFNNAVDEEIRNIQNANNKLTSVRYTTDTRQITNSTGIYDNIEELTGAVFKYNTETGEAITKTMKWAQIGSKIDNNGNEKPIMGWVQGLTTYNKTLDESSVKVDTFIEKQKKAVANANNTLSTIESKLNDKGANKTLANTNFDANGLTQQLQRVRDAITALENANKNTFTQAKIDVDTEITSLNNLITTLKNAEYAATSLRTKDISTIKIDEENNLNAFVQKMEQSGHYTDELKQRVTNLKSQLNGVFDTNTLTAYLNALSNLQSEFKTIDATAKTAEKATKIQTSVDAEKKILQAYSNELKESGLLTDDVKQKIQGMLDALSKVDSQNGLTTWRAELKGVKAEIEAILASTAKEKSEEEKLINAMANVREKTEQARQAEEKRQQLAQNNAINKALEEEYKERQKNIQAQEKQAELNRKNALAFTESASKKLSSAISKYSYGDSSDATAMMKQMNRGLSNFGDLSNVDENIKQLSSTVDKIIADLKLSHEQSLSALNQEIKAEQTVQAQKDSFNQKNINAIDLEIQKREQEAKSFSSMLQAQMQAEQKLADQANKIQLSFDAGAYDAKVTDLIAKTNQWTDANGNARISTTNLSKALDNLTTAEKNLASSNTVSNRQVLIDAEEKLDIEVKKVTNSIKKQNAVYAKDSSISSLHNKIQEFYDKNSAAHFRWGNQLKQMLVQTANGANLTKDQVAQISVAFNQVVSSARQAGKLGKSFFDTIKSGMKSFTYWTSSTFIVMKTIQSIKSAVSTVKELDTALVDLKKTTTMSAKELEDFYYASNETAKKMGVTTQSIIEQASAWSRLGYSSQEAATKMAEYSSMFATISPGMNLDSATDGLVSVMKAFKIGAEDVDDVVDGIMSKINIIGNTQALNNSDIVEFLTRSSSAMAEANNSLEETIALGTAATEITRDAASVGNMLKTVSMRIRGYDEEMESYSEELENLSGKIADLTKTVSTPGGVSLFTDVSKTTYKSTYQILKDISEIYDELEDKTQAELLETLAGKRQGQAVAAIINNFANAEKSMESMANSAGNAEAEMAIAIDSIAYKTNTLSEIGTGISQNLFGREDMKTVLDTINSLGERIQWLTDKLGLFGSIGLGAGVVAGFKNVGIGMSVVY